MIYDIEYLHAPDPGTLETSVRAWVGEGWDLQGPPIVLPALGYIGQQVVRYNASHEYKLVQGGSFEIMARDLNKLRLEGWDVFQTTVVWLNTLLQWVSRPRERELRYLTSDLQLETPPMKVEHDLSYNIGRRYTTYIPENTDPVKLKLVERVQHVLQMVPYPVDSFRSHRITDE